MYIESLSPFRREVVVTKAQVIIRNVVEELDEFVQQLNFLVMFNQNTILTITCRKLCLEYVSNISLHIFKMISNKLDSLISLSYYQ